MRIDRGEPFVDQSHAGRAHQPGQRAGVLTRFGCRRTFFSGESARQPHHYLDDGVFLSESGDASQVAAPLVITRDRLDRGGEDAVGVAHRDPDPGLTHIDAQTTTSAHLSR